MNRFWAAALICCLLLTSGCSARQTNLPADSFPMDEVKTGSDSGEPSAPTFYEDGDWTIFTCEGLEVPIPTKYVDLLSIKTGFEASAHPAIGQCLISLTEKASVEAFRQSDWYQGDDMGMGALFGISVYDQQGADFNLEYDLGGWELFAKDDNGHYYAIVRPTDVRLYRAEESIENGIDTWTELNEMSATIIPEMIVRNGLSPCTPDSFIR